MTPVLALWFALLAAPATAPATPPPSEPTAAQPAQAPAPTVPTPSSTNQTSSAEPSGLTPDSAGIYKVGDGVTKPIFIDHPEPEFTKIARKQKVSGVAVVSFVVDKQGNPVNVHITKSIADTVGKNKKKQAAALSLDQAAVDAVKQYKFRPAMMNGKPVAVYLKADVDFQIHKGLAVPSCCMATPTALTAPGTDQTSSTQQSSPNPSASEIYKVGKGVTVPRDLYMPPPKYTALAREQKISGVATLSIIVDVHGNPRNVQIVHSIADNVDKYHKDAALSLDQAAINAVKQYKFKPATLQGKPVAVYLNVEVNFKMF